MVAVALTALSNCRDSNTTRRDDSGDTIAEFQRALQATITARSFRVEQVSGISGNTISVTDYQAPDRARRTNVGGTTTFEGEETIAIGNTIYTEAPGRPGFFKKGASPEPFARTVIVPLEVAQKARSVRREGGSFLFTTGRPQDDSTIKGTATVANGYILVLTIEEESKTTPYGERYLFSMVNRAPAVEIPRADQVIAEEESR
jgi:hypothetical protein